MSMKQLFIQGIGLLGTILFFLSFQCRKNKNLFRVQFLSYLCYTTHLLMLGAVTGGISFDNILKAKMNIMTATGFEADAVILNPADMLTLLQT